MRKTAIVALSIILVLLVGVLGTVAYATTDSGGEFPVTLTDGNGMDIAFTGGNESVPLLPGMNVAKEITLTNNSTTKSYVWFVYAIPSSLVKGGFISIEKVLPENSGWEVADSRIVTLNETEYIIYPVYYKTAISKGETATVKPYSISMASNVDKDSFGNLIFVKDGEISPVDYNTADGVSGIFICAFGVEEAIAGGDIATYMKSRDLLLSN